jgi:hypothetical protein
MLAIYQFLGAMQFRKAPSSFILSVSLSAWSSATPTGRIFVKIHIWDLSLSVSIYLFCLKNRKHSICLNNHVQLQTTGSGPYIGDGLFSMWRKSWGRRKSWLYRHNNEARLVVNLTIYGVSTINTVSSRFRGNEGNYAAVKKRRKLAVHVVYNVQRHIGFLDFELSSVFGML